ncbi:hypothetical protein C6T65_00275 [Burkholderia vietnamiensis]|uniref:Uncharacterized protein n=1 Tax=Burkholderia vietnamiensis TaxID=60552 RepID=A0AA44Y4W9_BURVI|nr:hypothetical protein C6T65_00275 [Burkholderia vietnamiensis]
MVEDGGSVDGGHGGCRDRADEDSDDTPTARRPGAFAARLLSVPFPRRPASDTVRQNAPHQPKRLRAAGLFRLRIDLAISSRIFTGGRLFRASSE